MKNNYITTENLKREFIAFMIVLCGLFANTAVAQKNIGFTGATDNNWSTATNWSYSGVTVLGTQTNNSTTVTLTVANTDIAVGDLISGPAIASGTTVTAIAGAVITISQATLALGTNTNVTFTFAVPKVSAAGPAANEIVVISNGKNPTINAGVYNYAGLIISNATGAVTGSTLTLNAGVTFNISSATPEAVVLRGGNIVNNGTLNVTGTLTTGTAANFSAFAITCGSPIVLPSTPTEFGYSGIGTLNINTSAGTFTSGGIHFNGVEATASKVANTTYKFLFNGVTNFTLSAAKSTAATPSSSVNCFRLAGGSASFGFPVIIGGTGFTIGSATTGVPFGILNQSGGGTKITINPETTLTAYSTAGNGSHIFSYYSYANIVDLVNGTIYFTNKGTLNMYGSTTRSGLSLNTEFDGVITFENQGTINVDMVSTGAGQGALAVPQAATTKSPNASQVNFINKGILTLKTSLSGAAGGSAILVSNAGQTPNFLLDNSGVLTMTGTSFNTGGRPYNPSTFIGSQIINSGTLTTNQELRAFTTTNTSTGTITFTNTGESAAFKLATFTVATTVSATIGATYTDANLNVHTVALTKVGSTTGTTLYTTVAFAAVVPGLASLNRTSGTGDATIAISALSILNKNALTSFTSNSGVINTTKGSSYLNIISGVSTDAATSVISPGGDTEKGIAINAMTLDPAILQGKLKLQVSGNTTAGVDYDQYNATGQVGGFNISGATLDLTSIYKPLVAVTIDIMTTLSDPDPSLSGSLAGNFASVVGLISGWSVVYTEGLGGKVQLAFDPALGTQSANFSNFKFSYYPNPSSNQLNVSAEKNINKVELFNLLGQKVQSNTVNTTQKQFDISNLQNGVYIMEVTIDNAKEAFKIIKQ
jgi:trimeric autotransporter adhesin